MADKKFIAALFKLTPQEAVDYLQERGQLAQTFSWQDIWQEEHATHFTVSRLANLDLLQAIQDGITQNVNGDLSRRDWTKNVQALLEKAGWWGEKEVLDPSTGEMVTTTFDPARLKLIFDTNTRMAYSAGLWQRIERNKKTHPYVRYITKRDERVRELHRSWDNLTLPVDHPFWKTHFPPNGWRCRCRAMSISQAEYDKGLSPLGEKLNKTAPEIKYRDWVNKRTGVVERVPRGIDPGFGYNPGMARAANLAQVEAQKLTVSATILATQYRATSDLSRQATAFVAQALADRKSKQAALEMVSVPEAFSVVSDALDGIKTAGKRMALDHDTTLHIMDEHSADLAVELARGQIPIDALDFVLLAEALPHPVSVKLGDPIKSNNGAYRLETVFVNGGWRYLVVFEVRRLYIVPYTMWKWLHK